MCSSQIACHEGSTFLPSPLCKPSLVPNPQANLQPSLQLNLQRVSLFQWLSSSRSNVPTRKSGAHSLSRNRLVHTPEHSLSQSFCACGAIALCISCCVPRSCFSVGGNCPFAHVPQGCEGTVVRSRLHRKRERAGGLRKGCSSLYPHGGYQVISCRKRGHRQNKGQLAEVAGGSLHFGWKWSGGCCRIAGGSWRLTGGFWRLLKVGWSLLEVAGHWLKYAGG